jgi:hypothetical protein
MGTPKFSFKSHRFCLISKKPKTKSRICNGYSKILTFSGPLVAANTDNGWTFCSFKPFKPFKPLVPPNPHIATQSTVFWFFHETSRVCSSMPILGHSSCPLKMPYILPEWQNGNINDLWC